MIRPTGHGRPAPSPARFAAVFAALAAALVLVPAAAHAAALPYDLGELPTQRFTGAPSSGAGTSMAGGCDVDDDGVDDLVVGAPTLNPTGTPRAPGGAYIAFGGRARLDGALLLRGDLGKDADAPQTGAAVACAGDVNDDGVDDVLVGAPAWAPVGAPNGRYGAVYVVFGAPALATLASIDLANLGSRGFVIQGVAYTASVGIRLGSSVSGIGDVTGDGLDDIAVSTSAWRGPAVPASLGGAYIVAGKATTATVDLATPGSAIARFTGLAAQDQLDDVARFDDVNGDGVAELAVAVRGHDHDPDDAGPDPARTDGGSVYVLDGATSRSEIQPTASPRPAEVLFAIRGSLAAEQAGSFLAPAGDVNGDGRRDLLVGSVTSSDTSDGFVTVVFGGPQTTDVDLAALGSRGYRIRDPANALLRPDLAAAAGVGDVNGDDRDDIVVGMPGRKEVAVVYGKATTTTQSLDGFDATQGARVAVTGAFPTIGRAVAGVGDVTGDGHADLAFAGTGRTGTGDTSGFVDVVALPDPDEEEQEEPAVEEVDVTADWGIRANLRGYVYSSTSAADYVPGLSPPPILAQDGATCFPNPDAAVGGCDPRRKTGSAWPSAFTWTPSGAELDVAGDEAVVATRGRIVLSYPSHCFTITVLDPRWTLNGPEASVSVRLVQDVVEGCSAAGAPGAVSTGDSDRRVTLGTFPIVSRTVRDKSITWKTGQGTLGAEGNEVLALLYVGAELDPATITVPRAIGGLPSLEGEGRPTVVEVPGPTVERTVTVTTPAPPAFAPAPKPPVLDTRAVTGTVRGTRTGKRKVTVTLSRVLGSDEARAYRVWLTRGGRSVATGTLDGRTLTLTMTGTRKVTGKGKRRKMTTTYPRLSGSYTLRPASGGTALPTVTVKLGGGTRRR